MVAWMVNQTAPVFRPRTPSRKDGGCESSPSGRPAPMTLYIRARRDGQRCDEYRQCECDTGDGKHSHNDLALVQCRHPTADSWRTGGVPALRVGGDSLRQRPDRCQENAAPRTPHLCQRRTYSPRHTGRSAEHPQCRPGTVNLEDMAFLSFPRWPPVFPFEREDVRAGWQKGGVSSRCVRPFREFDLSHIPPVLRALRSIAVTQRAFRSRLDKDGTPTGREGKAGLAGGPAGLESPQRGSPDGSGEGNCHSRSRPASGPSDRRTLRNRGSRPQRDRRGHAEVPDLHAGPGARPPVVEMDRRHDGRFIVDEHFIHGFVSPGSGDQEEGRAS